MFRNLLIFALFACGVLAVPFDTTYPPLFGVLRCVLVAGVYFETTVTPPDVLTTLQPSLFALHTRLSAHHHHHHQQPQHHRHHHYYHHHSGGSKGHHAPSDNTVSHSHIIKDPNQDYEQAEEAVFHAIEVVEESVVHALQDEVKVMFPHEEHTHHQQHKTTLVNKKKKHQEPAQNEGLQIRFEKEGQPFPYDLQGLLDTEKQEQNIAHAVEVAEKAVVHAIEQEVDAIFQYPPKLEKQPTKATRSARKTANPGNKKHSHKGEAEHDYHTLEEFLEFTEE